MIMRYSLSLVPLISIVAACSSATPKAATPVAQASNIPASAAANPKATDDPTRGNVNISLDVRKACGLAEDEAYFAFDSAHVRDQDKKVLRKLADCFTTGQLKGRQMSLIGHADPRGTADYNMALAGRRADNVKQLVVAESMNENSVSTTSRGAMDASGTDEASWASDRSVDIKLGS